MLGHPLHQRLEDLVAGSLGARENPPYEAESEALDEQTHPVFTRGELHGYSRAVEPLTLASGWHEPAGLGPHIERGVGRDPGLEERPAAANRGRHDVLHHPAGLNGEMDARGGELSTLHRW